MIRDSELISTLPPAIQQAATALKRWGAFSFWSSIILTLFSGAALLLGLLGESAGPRSLGAGAGAFWAVSGLVSLLISIFFSWRYWNLGKVLQYANPSDRPKRADTQRIIKIGLWVSVSGMLLSLLGTQSVVGSVLIKAVRQTGANVISQQSCIVIPADIFSIAANTTALTAHFIGIAVALWLMTRLAK
jgi:hypothetical protein